MSKALHPSEVLYAGGQPFPALAACEHYAGSEKLLLKALDLQNTLQHAGVPLFDVTADCEDGAPVGGEREHATLIAALINSSDNRFDRLGARIHDVRHPAWQDELGIIVGNAGWSLAYLVLPKAEGVADVAEQIAALAACRAHHRITHEIPVHVLIETPGALHEVWQIAALPEVESLDFGLMDYVSAQHGAIPAYAMQSPGQFEHPLIARAKCEVATAALAHGKVPSHNVTTEFRDTKVVTADARRARQEFGFLRMWSIHPNQIEPIIAALRPDFNEVEEAGVILCAAAAADWGPTQQNGKLYDRAAYRYYWELLQRARLTGTPMAQSICAEFFNPHPTPGDTP